MFNTTPNVFYTTCGYGHSSAPSITMMVSLRIICTILQIVPPFTYKGTKVLENWTPTIEFSTSPVQKMKKIRTGIMR